MKILFVISLLCVVGVHARQRCSAGIIHSNVCIPRNRPNESNEGCRQGFSNLKMEFRDDNVIDLTYEFNENTIFWPSSRTGFEWKSIITGFINDPVRYFISEGSFSQPEHMGTHMDAPRHFWEHGIMAAKVPLSSVIGPGCVVNLKRNGQRLEPDTEISIDDIMQWEQNNGGRIRSGSIVLLQTGYGELFSDRDAYYGTSMNGPESIPHLHFPGLSAEAAEWLISKRCIRAVGIDTASIDFAQSTKYGSHRILSEASIPIFENVANLDELDARCKFKIVALPQKISKGTGVPTRIIAVLD